jgi:hypothetical protein
VRRAVTTPAPDADRTGQRRSIGRWPASPPAAPPADVSWLRRWSHPDVRRQLGAARARVSARPGGPAYGAGTPARPRPRARRYTRWLFAGATDSLWAQLSERGRRRWPTPDSLAAFRRQIVAVITGFDSVLADSVVRTDTLVTATRYGVNARDGATYYVRFRLTPGDDRVAGIGAQDAGVAAATPYLGYRTRTPLRLPFAGEWMVIWGGRTVAENYHAAYPTQRFAMDLAPAADSAVFARALRGEPVRLEEFACFGHPVLAPAAGVVVTAVDTVPDHPAGTLPPFVGWGNHVVIDHGTGEFSMFDHLKQGSVPVRPGARVAAGAVVGACGISGRANHPGLHYDLLTRPAEGRGTFSLPAQFLDYTADGTPVARGEPHRGQRIRAPRRSSRARTRSRPQRPPVWRSP